MKILYACTLYPPAIGGAQIHLHCLASRMRALDHQVRVLCQASRNRQDWLRLTTIAPEPRRDYLYDGIPVTQLGFSVATRLRMLPWAISYYAAMEPSVRWISQLVGEQVSWPTDDLSLVHVSRVGREFLARAALEFARQRQIPFVLTPNHHPRWDGYLYREYDKIYREADAVIALTAAEKELLIRQKRVPAERIHVTGIGPMLAEHFSAEQFRAAYGIQDRFVLFLGQQLQYKGIGALIEAAPRVWRSHPDVRFVFIGPPSDYSAKLFARVKDQRLINLGGVDLETKTSALAACEFLCLPSLQESFGGVFVEAWSLGKPVIGGRIPPIASVIDDGQDGLLSSQDPDELASAINRMLSDASECQAMGAAGRTKTLARYTWDKLTEQTEAVYDTLVGGTRQAAAADSIGVARLRHPSVTRPKLVKVLMCHNFYQQRGGEDESFIDEVQLLEEAGHEVVQYTLHNNDIDHMSQMEVARRTIWNRNTYDVVRDLIRRERPDIVHCTNTFPLISPAIYHAASRENVPVVQALRNYRMLCLNAMLMRDGRVCEDCLGRILPWPGVVHGCYRGDRWASTVVATMSSMQRLLRTSKHRVTLFFAPSEFSRQKFIQGGVPAQRIVVKLNSVSPDPRPGDGQGNYVVFVGRLSEEKGLNTLLEAWSHLREPLPLKIVGDGPMSQRLQEASRQDPRVHWLGRKARDEVLEIIGQASCLVMPSVWYETFGRTIIESFAKGTPVIASRLGAMAERVEDGHTGLLFEPGNAADLLVKLQLHLSDPTRMRRAARQEYENKYRGEQNYAALTAIYQQALSLLPPKRKPRLSARIEKESPRVDQLPQFQFREEVT